MKSLSHVSLGWLRPLGSLHSGLQLASVKIALTCFFLVNRDPDTPFIVLIGTFDSGL